MKGRHVAALGLGCAVLLVAAFSLEASDNPIVAIGFEAQATRFVKGTVQTASQLAEKTAHKRDKHLAAERKAQVSALVARRVETHSISQFVLGPYMRQASEDERKRFEKALPDYLARLITSELGAFAHRTLTVNEVVPIGEPDGDVLVLSRIAGKSGLPLRVDWRVRPTPAGPKLVDVIVEGLSLAVVQREAFIGELDRNGGKLEKLISRLEGKPAGTQAAKAFSAKSEHGFVGVTSSN